MYKNTMLTGVTLILLFLISSVTVLSNNQDQDASRVESKVTTVDKLHYEHTETNSDLQLVQKAPKKVSNEKILAYRNARKQDDNQKMRELEVSFNQQFSNDGDSKVEVVTNNSGTVSYLGMPEMPDGATGFSQFLPLEWETDILVNPSNNDYREFNPAMVTGSDGTIYMACENYGLVNYNNYIQTFYSTDGGNSWIASGFMSSTLADLHEPSIAVGEGTEDVILISYIVDPLDGSLPYPEVATNPIPITTFAWTIVSVPIYSSYEGYAKPNIFTDSYDWSGWFAYLTCEWIVGSASNNYNVVFWRSTDYGSTWTDPPLVPLGDSDPYGWHDPDGTYGTSDNNVYVACYNSTDSTLYTIVSENFGFSFTDTIAINTLTYVPSHSVDPDIEAATVGDNVMIAFTTGSSSFNDVIGYTYSTDGGISWPSHWYLPGYTINSEFAAELNANEGGGSWHLCYTSNFFVYYSIRPQDLSGLWQTEPNTINDVNWASNSYPKKAITSNWATDEVGIAWADFRSPTGGDYDIYFDTNRDPTGIDELKDIFVTEHSLFQNYPNPFNPSTTIKYQIANSKPQNTTLQIYNSLGQLIRTLVNTEQSQGEYSVVWNGFDNNGAAVSSGVYYYKLTHGDFVSSRKLIKLK